MRGGGRLFPPGFVSFHPESLLEDPAAPFPEPPKEDLGDSRGQLGAVTQRKVPWVPRSRRTARAESSRHNHQSLGTKAES